MVLTHELSLQFLFHFSLNSCIIACSIHVVQCFQFHEVLRKSLSESLLKVRIGNLLEREAKVNVIMNTLYQVLLQLHELYTFPETLERVSTSLREDVLVNDLAPESSCIHLQVLVTANCFKELYTLYYCVLLLFANVKSFRLFMNVDAHEVIFFFEKFPFLYAVRDPLGRVYRSLIEVLEISLCIFKFQLVGKTLMLVCHSASILLYHFYHLFGLLGVWKVKY
jgi:hypothetical protein